MVETEPQAAELAGELQRVLSKLFSVLRRGDTRGAGNTGAGDLTLAQLSILLTLLESGPIRMTELAAHERVRTPTTTVAIRRLEKLGLVKRSRDPSDLRAVLVEVTPRGLVQHREALDARRAFLASMLANLSSEDRATLNAAIGSLERLGDQPTS
ncbi:MAG: MarR family transcriptional regulator [Mycolicibacterium frederiksbergense]|uniref:MarR family transcriptional regulator n=1 Tax=Mycolicibacterium frederiksbergense TaxID=117567 RepID=A0A6H0S4D2_9MYCO|nr:MarR family transcriptional regulator [Mycolicibacterium frederiksbergense]MBX9919194.1 MarR family transcriptional regulator [Mycolicibacterium frederiksbergense]MDZ7883265.1 MarR family transcriptional regulator [Mycobacterium sp.]QIV82016.1 MarR family transcriptional regulator [Mycolicibacterium frederiksbergense]